MEGSNSALKTCTENLTRTIETYETPQVTSPASPPLGKPLASRAAAAEDEALTKRVLEVLSTPVAKLTSIAINCINSEFKEVLRNPRKWIKIGLFSHQRST